MIHLIALLLGLAPVGDELLANGDFEARPAAGDPVPGWTLELGATNAGEEPRSRVEIDSEERHSGRGSLHFRGEAATRGWTIARQAIPVRPGGDYTLEGWTRTRGVVKEGMQFHNCYLMLIFQDAVGETVARQYRTPDLPTSDWSRMRVEATAPVNARKAFVYLFLSMSGELWVDDLELAIEGGEEIPGFEPVFAEDFAKARSLSSRWKKEVGATNGTGGEDSKVEIDRSRGAPDSPHSLKLSGDRDTLRWYALRREFKAAPGELFRLSARVKAEEVRREGVQFQNLHLHLFFLDRRGETLGSVQFVHPGEGTYDWKPVAVEAIAPLEAKKVRAGVFLSMSGAVWIDDIEIEKQAGNDPPYSDFVKLEKKGIALHYSEDDPRAGEAKQYLQRLVDQKAEICRRLELGWKEPIDIFLYADDAAGRALTGRDLDFADPSGRRVHQRWNSTIGHEMVHVIAHNSLNHSQTGILGEGIAVWLDGRSDAAHHRLAAELLGQGELPGVAGLLSDFGAQSNSYPASGSFCGWFIAEHGLEAFKEVYPLTDPSARAKELVGKDFEEMEADWHAELAKYR